MKAANGASKFGRFGDAASTPGSTPGSMTRPTFPARAVQFQSPSPGQATRSPEPSPATSFRAVQRTSALSQTSDDVQVAQQVAAWDSEMDSIDKKQEQLLNDQWRLLRTQIGSLMGALAEVRSELSDLKNNVVGKEMEAVISNMVAAHDGHDTNHSSLIDRVTYLETAMGESVDQHGSHGEHKAGMEKRMEYIENLLGESADKHENHKTTVETRLEYLEGLLGDSAEKHASEIENAKSSLSDLHAAILQCSKAEHHSSLEERVDYLEKFLGESADKHAQDVADHKGVFEDHKTSMETRLEYLEGLLGDSADKHATEIQAAHNKLADLHAAISSCAKAEHHSSLEDRLDYIENFIGESKDKHNTHKATVEQRLTFIEKTLDQSADDLNDHKKAHGAHKETIEQRIESLEAFHKEVAGQTAQDLAAANRNHAAHKTASELRLSKLENTINNQHKNDIAANEQKLGEMQTALNNRFDTLENKHLAEFSNLKHSMRDLDNKSGSFDSLLKSCATVDKLSLVERRIGAVEEKQARSDLEERFAATERRVLDGTENNSRRLSTMEAGHLKLKTTIEDVAASLREERSARSDGVSSLVDRVDRVENVLKDPVDRCLKDMDAAQVKLRDLTSKVDVARASLDGVKGNMEQRLSTLEAGISEGRLNGDFLREIDQRIHYLQEDEKRARDILESSMKEHIRLEHSQIAGQGSQIKEQWEREARARQAYMDNYKELLVQERKSRDISCQQLDDRLRTCERRLDMPTPQTIQVREPEILTSYIPTSQPSTSVILAATTPATPHLSPTMSSRSLPATRAPMGTITGTVASYQPWMAPQAGSYVAQGPSL